MRTRTLSRKASRVDMPPAFAISMKVDKEDGVFYNNPRKKYKTHVSRYGLRFIRDKQRPDSAYHCEGNGAHDGEGWTKERKAGTREK